MKPSLVLGATACALAVPAVAWAQPAREMDAIARNHFENGSRYFAIHRYDEAAREFLAAYELSRRPELLFNLGRSYEEAGRHVEALDAYQRYAATTVEGYDRTALELRMTALRERIRAAAPPSGTPPPTATTAAPPAVPPPPPRRDRTLPIVLTAAGGVALATGLVLGITVASTHGDLSAACPGGACPPERQADADSASTRAVVADVVGGVGLAALAVGVVWLLLPGGEQRPAAPTPRVSVGCGPAGCVGGVRVAF